MIDQTHAIEIARKFAEEKGWAFAEPLDVRTRRRWFGDIKHFEIETNAGKLGTKARFVIDAVSGTIMSSGYIRR